MEQIGEGVPLSSVVSFCRNSRSEGLVYISLMIGLTGAEIHVAI